MSRRDGPRPVGGQCLPAELDIDCRLATIARRELLSATGAHRGIQPRPETVVNGNTIFSQHNLLSDGKAGGMLAHMDDVCPGGVNTTRIMADQKRKSNIEGALDKALAVAAEYRVRSEIEKSSTVLGIQVARASIFRLSSAPDIV